MLIALMAATILQTAPESPPRSTLSTIALCVASLEYPGAYPRAGETLAVWRQALARVEGADATSQQAAVTHWRNEFDRMAAETSVEGAIYVRAVGPMMPHCLDDETVSRVQTVLDREAAEGADD